MPDHTLELGFGNIKWDEVSVSRVVWPWGCLSRVSCILCVSLAPSFVSYHIIGVQPIKVTILYTRYGFLFFLKRYMFKWFASLFEISLLWLIPVEYTHTGREAVYTLHTNSVKYVLPEWIPRPRARTKTIQHRSIFYRESDSWSLMDKKDQVQVYLGEKTVRKSIWPVPSDPHVTRAGTVEYWLFSHVNVPEVYLA